MKYLVGVLLLSAVGYAIYRTYVGIADGIEYDEAPTFDELVDRLRKRGSL
jgi:hypothetical protein